MSHKQITYEFKVSQLIPAKFNKNSGQMTSAERENYIILNFSTAKEMTETRAIAHACFKINQALQIQFRAQKNGVKGGKHFDLRQPLRIQFSADNLKFDTYKYQVKSQIEVKVKKGNANALFEVFDIQKQMFIALTSKTFHGDQVLDAHENWKLQQEAEKQAKLDAYRKKIADKKAEEGKTQLTENLTTN